MTEKRQEARVNVGKKNEVKEEGKKEGKRGK
jgi:hypothetical protein